LYYKGGSAVFVLAWQDGGTECTMRSTVYTTSVSFNVFTRLTSVLDINVATTTLSALYLNGVAVSTVWSGAADARASEFPMFTMRAESTTAGAYDYNYLRVFPNVVAIAAEVSNNFKTRKDEETVWHLNGCLLGHTRCNVSKRVGSVDLERSIESPVGVSNPNNLSVQLYSPQGEFADDQYDTFNAAIEHYNGTLAQKYMRHRGPIEMETWYGGLYELEFTGRMDDSMFSRHSDINAVTTIALSAQDMAADLRRRVRQKAYKFENYSLSDPAAEASSLMHVISKMGTQTEWYNFLANSSFENATVTNSWTAVGATVARVASGLFGTYAGDLVGSVSATVYQVVDFTGTKKLNAEQSWNFSLYLACATARSGSLRLSAYDDAAEDPGFASANWTLTGGEGWKKAEVTLSVANATTTTSVDHLRVTVSVVGSATLSMDGAMLIQNDKALDWFVLNNNDGAAGEESADDADSALFDTAGFDVDDAMVTHPWAVVEQGTPVWDYLTRIADATSAWYMGFDACGTLKYRTPMKAGYADASALFTVDAVGAIDSAISIEQANKIIIHGIKIIKSGRYGEVWSAEKSSFFDRDANGYVYETVAASATWPEPMTYGEFWAKYEENNETVSQLGRFGL
jgi:hypothetical protein